MPHAQNDSKLPVREKAETIVADFKQISLPKPSLSISESDRQLVSFALSKLSEIESKLIDRSGSVRLQAASLLANSWDKLYQRKGINAVVSDIEDWAMNTKLIFDAGDPRIPSDQPFCPSLASINLRLGSMMAVQNSMARDLTFRLPLAERFIESGLIENLQSAKQCRVLTRCLSTNPNYFPEPAKGQQAPLQNVLNIIRYAVAQAVITNPTLDREVNASRINTQNYRTLSYRTFGILLTTDMILDAVKQTRVSPAIKSKVQYAQDNLRKHLSLQNN